MNRYKLTVCAGDPDMEIIEANLSYVDFMVITKSIAGIFNAEYLIKANNGRSYDVGIIDNIELIAG